MDTGKGKQQQHDGTVIMWEAPGEKVATTDVYSDMGRLKMIKLCKEKGLDYGSVAKDVEALRNLLRAAGEDGDHHGGPKRVVTDWGDVMVGEDGAAASIASGGFGGFEEPASISPRGAAASNEFGGFEEDDGAAAASGGNDSTAAVGTHAPSLPIPFCGPVSQHTPTSSNGSAVATEEELAADPPVIVSAEQLAATEAEDAARLEGVHGALFQSARLCCSRPDPRYPNGFKLAKAALVFVEDWDLTSLSATLCNTFICCITFGMCQLFCAPGFCPPPLSYPLCELEHNIVYDRVDDATTWLILAICSSHLDPDIAAAVRQLLACREFTNTAMLSNYQWDRLQRTLKKEMRKVGKAQLQQLYHEFNLGTVMNSENLSRLYFMHPAATKLNGRNRKLSQELVLPELFALLRDKIDFKDPAVMAERVALQVMRIVFVLLNDLFQQKVAEVAEKVSTH